MFKNSEEEPVFYIWTFWVLCLSTAEWFKSYSHPQSWRKPTGDLREAARCSEHWCQDKGTEKNQLPQGQVLTATIREKGCVCGHAWGLQGKTRECLRFITKWKVGLLFHIALISKQRLFIKTQTMLIFPAIHQKKSPILCEEARSWWRRQRRTKKCLLGMAWIGINFSIHLQVSFFIENHVCSTLKIHIFSQLKMFRVYA